MTFDDSGARMPPAVRADTVDEVVTVMYPRQVSLGRCAPLPAALRLPATDTGRTWTPTHEPSAPGVRPASQPSRVIRTVTSSSWDAPPAKIPRTGATSWYSRARPSTT